MTTAFPSDFLWGVATAAYQIEGAANEDGRGASIWDTFSHTPGKVTNGETGDVAVDHYHRFREDVQLIADLGVGAYRFSIAWPRILPNGTGQVNPAGLDFYRRLIDELDAQGIAAYATLYHWDLPQALEDRGGWRNRDTAYAFADYAAVVAEALGDRVAAWATFNEPWCSSYLGYGIGAHAPGIADMKAAFAAAHHLNLAHGLGVARLRDAGVHDVGIVLNVTPVVVVEPSPEHDAEADRVDAWRNAMWLDAIFDGEYSPQVMRAAAGDGGGLPIHSGDMAVTSIPIDWMGVNYYSDVLIPDTEQRPRTDMGWPITPGGMYDVLRMVHQRTRLPLYITENGVAYPDPEDGSLNDADRVGYLDAYLCQVRRAIEDGALVRGYFLWSLLDNFEWAEGFAMRFGLVHVDYDTLVRTPRASYHWYGQLATTNTLPED